MSTWYFNQIVVIKRFFRKGFESVRREAQYWLVHIPLAILGFLLVLAVAYATRDLASFSWPIVVLKVVILFIGTACSVVALVAVFKEVFVGLPTLGRVRDNPIDKLNHMKHVVRDLRDSIEPLEHSVKTGQLIPGQDGCEKCVCELVTADYERAAFAYKQLATLRLWSRLVLAAVSCVIIFAAFYLVLYAVDSDCVPGANIHFTESQMPLGGLTQMAVESVYWSSVTFITLGYGDVRPVNNCIVARMLVILETLVFLCLFTAAPAVGMLGMKEGFALTKDEFGDALRDTLKRLTPFPTSPTVPAIRPHAKAPAVAT